MKRESITINQKEPHYEIESITPVSAHVLQVVFTGDVPPAYGDIQVYTSGGSQCSDLPGYDTVYRDESQTVYLSDDGSVYQPPEEPEPVLPPEPYVRRRRNCWPRPRRLKRRRYQRTARRSSTRVSASPWPMGARSTSP